MTSPLMTQTEAAQYLRISLTTFKARVRPAIPCRKVGAKPLFLRSDLDAFITDHTTFVVVRPSKAKTGAQFRATSDARAAKVLSELD